MFEIGDDVKISFDPKEFFHSDWINHKEEVGTIVRIMKQTYSYEIKWQDRTASHAPEKVLKLASKVSAGYFELDPEGLDNIIKSLKKGEK